jgi:phosphatidylinositol-bisphosphatase
MAVFEVPCKVLLADRKRALAQQLGRQLDAWENECIPKVSMSTNTITFRGVQFDTPVTQTLRIENTGQVVVQFHFHPKLQDEAYCKPWLQLKPEFGIIPPKETQDIALTVLVDRKTATPLLTGQVGVQHKYVRERVKGEWSNMEQSRMMVLNALPFGVCRICSTISSS